MSRTVVEPAAAPTVSGRLQRPQGKEEGMIHVSDAAQELFEQMSTPEGQVLRLDPMAGQQISLVVGEPERGDQVVERNGTDLLHISAMVSQTLDGATIDRVDTPEGPRLGVQVPDEGAPTA
jgi:iron-sulfur cluster assembly protein